ncbi:MAG TPA: hypothetical protein VM115_05570 [Vicinamibacterales bacterium]|nr:hypothetical protein [Vicinamibacterales bacterium]
MTFHVSVEAEIDKAQRNLKLAEEDLARAKALGRPSICRSG